MSWILATAIVIALAFVIYQIVGSARDARRVPPPGHLFHIGAGRRLHLDCRGAGSPTVIFEAGIAASSLSWTLVQPRVAEFTRACSYDRAGLAWSDASRSRLGVVTMADELHALLGAAVAPAPYVLVAHSFGAFVAQRFASQHRHAVAGMVLVDPIYPSEWLDMTPEQRWRLSGGVFLSRVGAGLAQAGVVRACLDLLAGGSTGVPKRVSRLFGSEAAQVLDRLVGEVQKLPADVWPSVQAHWSRPRSFVSMARHLASLPRSAAEVAACGDLGDIPLVVITAASQPAACRAEHARMTALSSRGRHIVADKGGHWVHLDEPDLVVRSIRDVVEQVRHDAASEGTVRSTPNIVGVSRTGTGGFSTDRDR